MNRKFFTWVAGTLLLAASLSTANAQGSKVELGTPVNKIPTPSEGLYQLRVSLPGEGETDTFLLKLDNNGVVGLIKAAPEENVFTKEATYGHTLWCLNIDQSTGAPKIDFTNKAYGALLTVSLGDLGDTLDVDRGTYQGWTLSPGYTSVVAEKPLYTFSGDSLLVFALLTETGEPDTVTIVKTDPANIVGATKTQLAALSNAAFSAGIPASVLVRKTVVIPLFTITNPKPFILTATDFNTVLNTAESKERKLTFSPDATVASSNPWSANALKALDVDGDAGSGYLHFAQIANNKVDSSKFVRVDTVLRGQTDYLTFTYDSIGRNGTKGELSGTSGRSAAIKDQFAFQAKYFVAEDSIALYAKQAIFKPTSGTWYESTSTTVKDTDNGGKDKLLVRLNVPDANYSFLTLAGANDAGKPAATKIKLNLGCDGSVVTPGLTSLPEDVYVITKGDQVLAPTSDGSAQWVTYSAATVDPNYIPAYQWVIKKVRTGSLDQPMSPVRLTNRETDATLSLQLQFQGDSALLFDKKVRGADDFHPVPEAQKSNPFLGSFHPQDVEIGYSTYTLNYLNAFRDDFYLGPEETTANDTALYVTTSLTEYTFAKVGTDTVKYGYTPTPEEIKSGLVKLQYIPYTLKKNGVNGVAYNTEGRYVLLPDEEGVAPTVFQLKTTNTKEGDHYHALIALKGKTGNSGTALYKVDNKLKIDEGNRWAYVSSGEEPRSSAFHIQEYTTPLYRKFDGGEYTYGKGLDKIVEPIGTPENAPLWLKFKQNYTNQYLFENASTTNAYHTDITTSFLGLRNAIETPETDKYKYTFYVDTAFVNRKTGAAYNSNTIKPQYLLAVRPDIAPATETLPVLTKASYLFNAQDSVNTESPDYVEAQKYVSLGATRLAFVDAVHYKDTVFVLPPALKEKTAAELQEAPAALHALSSVRKAWLGQNTHYAPGLDPDLKKANHKSFVFQFRLAPGSAIEGNPTRSFLIETRASGGDIVKPTYGQWVKIENSVPVVSASATLTASGATVFNVEPGDENGAVSNEKIDATSKVRVVSGAGSVNILNATGKKVTVTNILGQNLATQVINSNNARISLPQGIVVVTVEGEPAVKAIVSR
jgi:hypothetical protein